MSKLEVIDAFVTSAGTKVGVIGTVVTTGNGNSVDISGVVIGALQAAHGVVDLATKGLQQSSPIWGKGLPVVGGVIGVGGLLNTYVSSEPLDLSGWSGVVSNGAAVVVGGLALAGAAPAILIGGSVLAVGAGIVQIVTYDSQPTYPNQTPNETARLEDYPAPWEDYPNQTQNETNRLDPNPWWSYPDETPNETQRLDPDPWQNYPDQTDNETSRLEGYPNPDAEPESPAVTSPSEPAPSQGETPPPEPAPTEGPSLTETTQVDPPSPPEPDPQLDLSITEAIAFWTESAQQFHQNIQTLSSLLSIVNTPELLNLVITSIQESSTAIQALEENISYATMLLSTPVKSPKQLPSFKPLPDSSAPTLETDLTGAGEADGGLRIMSVLDQSTAEEAAEASDSPEQQSVLYYLHFVQPSQVWQAAKEGRFLTVKAAYLFMDEVNKALQAELDLLELWKDIDDALIDAMEAKEIQQGDGAFDLIIFIDPEALLNGEPFSAAAVEARFLDSLRLMGGYFEASALASQAGETGEPGVQANLAPVAAQLLSDSAGEPGTALTYTLPTGTFTDPNAGDVLTYTAHLSNGSALPEWLSFDAATRTLSGTPPTGSDAELSIRITATDPAGAAASSVFTLHIEPDYASPVLSLTTHTLAEHYLNLTLTGTSAINGTGNTEANQLTGNSAANVLSGGSGDDTYVYNLGGATDTLVELNGEGHDTLRLGEGISPTPTGTRASREGTDLILSFGPGTTDQVRMTGYFDQEGGTVETIAFANGQAWDFHDALYWTVFAETPATKVKYFLKRLGGEVLDLAHPVIGLGQASSSAIHIVTGGAGADALYVGAGMRADARMMGSGADSIYFTGRLDDYLQAIDQDTGVYTLAHRTRQSEVIQFTSMGDSDVLYFQDGHIVFNANDDARLYDVDAETFMPIEASFLLRGGTTLNAPDATLAIQGVVGTTLSATLSRPLATVLSDAQAQGSVGTGSPMLVYVTGVDGQNLAPLHRSGQAMTVTGGSGADSVYVTPGTAIDARVLGAGDDRIYFTGQLSNYTQSIDQDTGVYTFTHHSRPTEVVKLTSMGQNDELWFADGHIVFNANADERLYDVNAETFMAVQASWLSAGGTPLLTERLEYSSDGGATWQDATSSVNGTTVTLSDPTLTGDSTIQLRVASQTAHGATVTRVLSIGNREPVLAQPLPEQVFSTQSGGSCTIAQDAFTDPDGDPLSYSLTRADGSALPYGFSFDAPTRTLQASSIVFFLPQVQLRVTATDAEGGQGSGLLSVYITPDAILPTFSSTSTTLAEGVRHLTLTADAAIDASGNSLANQLVGNSAANVLMGLDGDDALHGGAGADTLIGGSGNDLYFVDEVGDEVIELAGEGTGDYAYAHISYTLPEHVEGLGLLGGSVNLNADLNGTGNALNNKLMGNHGSNVLDGGTGADTLWGFGGNDTYVIDNAGDNIREMSSEGQMDVAQLWISFSFLANGANRQVFVERIEIMGSDALNATGNNKGNQIVGNGAANELRGGGGADTLLGGGGDDRLVIGTAERASLATSRHEGGSGQDTLALASDQSGVLLDLTAYGQTTFTGIERLDLTGGGNNTAKLTIDQLLHMPDAGEDRLMVLGDAGDAVQLVGGSGSWSSAGTQNWQGLDYAVYAHSGAAGRELLVQQGVLVM